MAYENIEKLSAILGEKEIGSLVRAVSASEKQVAELLRKLSEMEAALGAKRAEEEAARQREAEEQLKREREECGSSRGIHARRNP